MVLNLNDFGLLFEFTTELDELFWCSAKLLQPPFLRCSL